MWTWQPETITFSGYSAFFTCSGGTNLDFILPESFGHQQGMARNPEMLFIITANPVFHCLSKRKKAVWRQCLHWYSLDCELQYQSHLQSNVPQQSHSMRRHWRPVNCFAVKPEVVAGQYNLGWGNTCFGCKSSLDSKKVIQMLKLFLHTHSDITSRTSVGPETALTAFMWFSAENYTLSKNN